MAKREKAPTPEQLHLATLEGALVSWGIATPMMLRRFAKQLMELADAMEQKAPAIRTELRRLRK